VEGGVGEQTHFVLSRIASILESIGSSMNEVVKTTVYLARAQRDFHAMNRAYRSFFSSTTMPTRTTVGVELAIDVLVEVDAVAVRGAVANEV
jgi:2-iminobutanoate/2-iminopropanoate deaminase